MRKETQKKRLRKELKIEFLPSFVLRGLLLLLKHVLLLMHGYFHANGCILFLSLSLLHTWMLGFGGWSLEIVNSQQATVPVSVPIVCLIFLSLQGRSVYAAIA